ncbi:MAG: phospho-N-acetylmuramoyl-pentapeptide-transferase, partial [Gammaproteobacteria bacterium]
IQQAGISGTGAFVPFVGNTGPWSPVLWYVGSCLLLVFITNAVNLSDGLDGLVTIPVLLVAGGLGILGLLSDPLIVGDAFSGLPHLPGGRGAFLFAGALAGALLAFLWFNAPPARLFMGDTGALALGGVLGMIGIILNQHIFLLLMGGVFVLEGVSVVLQIFWFRWSSGGRLFRMAPFHHHLELGGWPETRITIRFWIITVVLVALSLTAALLTITLT